MLKDIRKRPVRYIIVFRSRLSLASSACEDLEVNQDRLEDAKPSKPNLNQPLKSGRKQPPKRRPQQSGTQHRPIKRPPKTGGSRW